MKKFIFIMPLMAVSLLASCNKGEPTYTITFNCIDCKAFDENDKEVVSITVPAIKSDYTMYQDYHFEGNKPFKVPLKSNISIKKTGTEEIVKYKYVNGTISVPIVGNLTITATGSSYSKDLKTSSWDEIAEIAATGRADEFFGIGNEKTITLKENGEDQASPHTVRIIGFNHDDLADDSGKAGITFEFANVITNSDGNADTTYWNDKDDTSSTNYKYSESTLNDYLNEGKNCIFNKLPDELKADGIIKEVYKPVAEAEGPQSIDDPSYEINDTYTTKLFPLSYREITASGDSKFAKVEGSTYPFYTGEGYDTDGNRIKRKVGIESGNGEYYWLRSPYTNISYCAWYVYPYGSLNGNYVYSRAYAVAPAFCI